MPFGEQNIFWFDIAMHNPVAVRTIERSAHIGDDVQRGRHIKRPIAIKPLPQRLTANQWHHVEQKSSGDAGIKERDDVRVVEPCRNLDLPLKPFRRQCRADRRAKELDRDVSTMSNIASQQHHGHTTPTDFGRQLVLTRHRFAKRHPFVINAHGAGYAKQVVIVRPIPERL